MTVGVVDTSDDEIPIFRGIKYTTSWLMTVGISSVEVRATRLSILAIVGCPHGFGVLLWKGFGFFKTYRKYAYHSSSAKNTEDHKNGRHKNKV